MQNHHLESISTSPQKTARPIFFHCKGNFGTLSIRSTHIRAQVSMLCACAYCVLTQEPLSCATTVTTIISNCMHTLEFNFHTVTNAQAIDALVYALSIELWLKHRIESYQTANHQLHFERESDCMLASLVLSANNTYTVTLVK